MVYDIVGNVPFKIIEGKIRWEGGKGQRWEDPVWRDHPQNCRRFSG
jgi:hypothetical protein